MAAARRLSRPPSRPFEPPCPHALRLTLVFALLGAPGRIVLEDADSVISGLPTAIVVPGEGEAGFARGVFDPSRFVGGTTDSDATTLPVALGPILRPELVALASLEADDFLAGIPTKAALGIGKGSIVVELQGYLATPDGEVDETTATGWYVVGYFENSGSETDPLFHADAAPVGFTPEAGVGIGNLDGRTTHVEVRVSFFLPGDLEPADPGPFVEHLRIRFTSDT